MTMYATLMCVVLGLTTIILLIMHIIAQSQERKALLEEQEVMKECNRILEKELDRIKTENRNEFNIEERKRYTDWDNRSKNQKNRSDQE